MPQNKKSPPPPAGGGIKAEARLDGLVYDNIHQKCPLPSKAPHCRSRRVSAQARRGVPGLCALPILRSSASFRGALRASHGRRSFPESAACSVRPRSSHAGKHHFSPRKKVRRVPLVDGPPRTGSARLPGRGADSLRFCARALPCQKNGHALGRLMPALRQMGKTVARTLPSGHAGSHARGPSAPRPNTRTAPNGPDATD